MKLGEKEEKEERGELKTEGEGVGRNFKIGRGVCRRRDEEIGGQKRGTRERREQVDKKDSGL